MACARTASASEQVVRGSSVVQSMAVRYKKSGRHAVASGVGALWMGVGRTYLFQSSGMADSILQQSTMARVQVSKNASTKQPCTEFIPHKIPHLFKLHLAFDTVVWRNHTVEHPAARIQVTSCFASTYRQIL